MLGVFYRPPSSGLEPLEILRREFDFIQNKDIVLVEDLNLPDIDWCNNLMLNNSEM